MENVETSAFSQDSSYWGIDFLRILEPNLAFNYFGVRAPVVAGLSCRLCSFFCLLSLPQSNSSICSILFLFSFSHRHTSGKRRLRRSLPRRLNRVQRVFDTQHIFSVFGFLASLLQLLLRDLAAFCLVRVHRPPQSWWIGFFHLSSSGIMQFLVAPPNFQHWKGMMTSGVKLPRLSCV